MSSGALGGGTYRSVVARTRFASLPTYYNSAYELIQLHRAHKDVLHCFYVRDKVFDNKFPSTAIANGLFKLVPNKRSNYHARELMEAVRRRTIWIQRIQRQRVINNEILTRAAASLTPQEMSNRFSYHTPDANVYFCPTQVTTSNTWPNYWQHPSMLHVVPKPHWLRATHMDGITRVCDPQHKPSQDY